MTFGEHLKELRIQQRMTLRDCADKLGVDASNWSKFERGVSPAPKDAAVLDEWADTFKIKGEARQRFLDLAALSRNQLPEDIAADEHLIAKLPAFFRAVRGKELEGEKLKEFIVDLRAVHRPAKD